ncbi:MAG: RnfABCDGE type electron transport complex subunit B [Planctomycetes bacterium]|nr:RnfABCDGE type electron transport complex subunit B [Planctomycetota bacterium]
MNDLAIAAGIMGGLGLFFGVLLAVASRLLKVPEDPRLDVLEGMLPGTNCGACGQPGCRGFAEALLEGRSAPSGCTVSSPTGVEKIAGFLGVAAGERVVRVARLHCAGGRAQAEQIAAYEGFANCRAASVVAGGGKGCAWGCLGLGDCEVACTFDAIAMNDNGLPVVDVAKCTACGDCVDACPRDLFEILPLSQPLLVQCKAPLAGDAARELCRVACDACGRCAQDAPEGVIRMVDNLPVFDPFTPAELGPEVTFRCPTGAIQWVPRGQFTAVRADRGFEEELT